jgi:hypothetical protein
MATTHIRAQTRGAWRKAPLTADSPDSEARAMAANPEVMAAIEAARIQARQPGGTVSQEELDRNRPHSPEAEAEAAALLQQWDAEDASRQ